MFETKKILHQIMDIIVIFSFIHHGTKKIIFLLKSILLLKISSFKLFLISYFLFCMLDSCAFSKFIIIMNNGVKIENKRIKIKFSMYVYNT